MTGGDRAIRASTAAVVVGIGAIAAYVSYRHALDVARAHGEPGSTGRLVPLTIDGLVYVASMVLLDAARRRAPVPFLARPALALGIGATVAVNVLHGIAHGLVGAVIAAWPAVTLVVTVELLMGMIRAARHPVATPALDEDEKGTHSVRTLDGEALPWWPLPDVGAAGQGPSGYALWDEIEPDEEHARDRAADEADDLFRNDPEKVLDPELAPVVATARDRFAEVLATGSLPSVRRIRRELRVGHPRAVAVRQALAGEAG